MANYIMLVKWTSEGAHNFKDLAQTDKGISGTAKGLGGELTSEYWTLGEYDSVAVLTAPDDETATAIALAATENGAMRTTTLRAFEPQEFNQIVERAS